MYRVLVSREFQKRFNDLPSALQARVRKALKCLETDPYKPRSGADIRPLESTNPPKHRIRTGDLRVVYLVEGQTVKVLDLFHRGRGYGP